MQCLCLIQNVELNSVINHPVSIFQSNGNNTLPESSYKDNLYISKVEKYSEHLTEKGLMRKEV